MEGKDKESKAKMKATSKELKPTKSRDLKSTLSKNVKERSANLVDRVKVSGNVFGQSQSGPTDELEYLRSQKGLESPLYARLAAVKVRVKNLKTFLKLLKNYRENGLNMAKGDLLFAQQLGECKKYIPNFDLSENLGNSFSQTMQRLSEFVLELASIDFLFYDELSVVIEKLTVFIGTSFSTESEKNFEITSIDYEKSTKQIQTFKSSKKWHSEKNVIKLYQMEQERAKIFKEYTKVIQEVEQYCDEVDFLISDVLNDIVLIFQKKKTTFVAKEESACTAFALERSQLRAANQNLQKFQYLQKLTYLFNEQEFADTMCNSFKDVSYHSIGQMLHNVGVGLPSFLTVSQPVDTNNNKALDINFFKTNYDEIISKLNEGSFKEHAISLTEVLTLLLDDECEAMMKNQPNTNNSKDKAMSFCTTDGIINIEYETTKLILSGVS